MTRTSTRVTSSATRMITPGGWASMLLGGGDPRRVEVCFDFQDQLCLGFTATMSAFNMSEEDRIAMAHDLRRSVRELRDRGLVVAAKWSVQLQTSFALAHAQGVRAADGYTQAVPFTTSHTLLAPSTAPSRAPDITRSPRQIFHRRLLASARAIRFKHSWSVSPADEPWRGIGGRGGPLGRRRVSAGKELLRDEGV
jgi:hypothetical protein